MTLCPEKDCSLHTLHQPLLAILLFPSSTPFSGMRFQDEDRKAKKRKGRGREKTDPMCCCSTDMCASLPLSPLGALCFQDNYRQDSGEKGRESSMSQLKRDESLQTQKLLRIETHKDESKGTIINSQQLGVKGRKREEEKKGESQRALLRPFFSLHFSFTSPGWLMTLSSRL